MRFLTTFWQFSRPHTIIGSFLSIVALYAIAVRDVQVSWFLLAGSLAAALCCNVYITGLNQWADVEVDRINKPLLPIPAGRLTRQQAMVIVLFCGLLSLFFAALFSWGFVALIALIMGIGTAYSLPPLKFKRHHLGAAAAIAVVRGLLVNVGFYLHFNYEHTRQLALEPAVWPLVFFVAAFSLGIAWFKDIPDTLGDKAHSFGTLAVLTGRQTAFRAGVVAVSLAYLAVVFAALQGILPAPVFFTVSHLWFLMMFWWQAWRLQVEDNKQVKRFYYFFWGLFFVEYLVYAAGFYVENNMF